MAKTPKPNSNEAKWHFEISKMQTRIETLKAKGVNVHYSITKPEKITKRDIEQIQSIKRGRMLKGVSNKQISLRVEVPPTLKINRLGRIVPKAPVKTEPRSIKETSIEKAIERDVKEEVKRELRRAADEKEITRAKAKAKEGKKPKSDSVRKAEQETGLFFSQWSFAPDEEEEDYKPLPKKKKEPEPKTETRKKLEEIISKAKAKSISSKFTDSTDIAEEISNKAVTKAEAIKASEALKEAQLQEIAEQDGISVEELKREAERRALQEELENKAAEAQQKAESDWRKNNPTHKTWIGGLASEKALKQIKEEYYPEDVDFTKQYTGLKSNEILYFEDRFTGTRYRYDDSRIFKRDLRGSIMHDENGKPLINEERFIKVITQPLGKDELYELQKNLLKQRYNTIASDRGEIISQALDELFDALPPEAVVQAFNALASTKYGSITFADMYEGNGAPLANKLRRMYNSRDPLVGKKNRYKAEKILKKYADILDPKDEEAESHEPPV